MEYHFHKGHLALVPRAVELRQQGYTIAEIGRKLGVCTRVAAKMVRGVPIFVPLRRKKRLHRDQRFKSKPPVFEDVIETPSSRKLCLIKERGHECENCYLTEWCGEPIPLEQHHKDDDKNNNVRSNLELLCPNCHALTDNYRGKGKASYQQSIVNSSESRPHLDRVGLESAV